MSNDNDPGVMMGKLFGTVFGAVLAVFVWVVVFVAYAGFYLVGLMPGILLSAYAHRSDRARKQVWTASRYAFGVVFIPWVIMQMADFFAAHVQTKFLNWSYVGWDRLSGLIFAPRLLDEYGGWYLLFGYVAFQLIVVAPICIIFDVAKLRGFNMLRGQLQRDNSEGAEVRLPRPGLIARLRQFKKVQPEAGYVTLGRSEVSGHVVKLGAERSLHMQIVGSSGSGKTETIKRMIESDMADGRPVIWIDGKGDIKNAAWFAAIAEKHGRAMDARYFLPEFKHGSYNPFRNGSPTEMKDRLMSSMVWSEEYYKDRCEEILQVTLSALCSIPDKWFTLEDLADALDPTSAGLQHLIAKCQDERARKNLARFAKDKEWQGAVSGLRAKLNSFVLSDFGSMITSKKNPVNLWRAYEERRPVYIGLPIGMAPQLMPRFGKMFLAELNSLNSAIAAGRLAKNSTGTCSVIIDEFSNFVCDLFIAFLQTARSQGFFLTIAHQSLGDLEKFDQAMRKQILGNTNIKLVFKQDEPEDAEVWARLIGTRQTFEKTHQVEDGLFGENSTGLGSMKEIEEFIAHPNIIKNLPTGYGIFVRKQPRLITPVGCSLPTEPTPEVKAAALRQQLANTRHDGLTDDWALISAKAEPLVKRRPVEQAKPKQAPAPVAKVQPELKPKAKEPVAPAPAPLPSANDDEPSDVRRRKHAASLTHGGEW